MTKKDLTEKELLEKDQEMMNDIIENIDKISPEELDKKLGEYLDFWMDDSEIDFFSPDEDDEEDMKKIEQLIKEDEEFMKELDDLNL